MMELRAGWIERFLLPVPDPTFRMECLALFKKEEGERKEKMPFQCRRQNVRFLFYLKMVQGWIEPDPAFFLQPRELQKQGD